MSTGNLHRTSLWSINVKKLQKGDVPCNVTQSELLPLTFTLMVTAKMSNGEIWKSNAQGRGRIHLYSVQKSACWNQDLFLRLYTHINKSTYFMCIHTCIVLSSAFRGLNTFCIHSTVHLCIKQQTKCVQSFLHAVTNCAISGARISRCNTLMIAVKSHCWHRLLCQQFN